MYYDILYYIHEEITQTEQEITNIHNKAMAEANFDICITLIISNSERIKLYPYLATETSFQNQSFFLYGHL